MENHGQHGAGGHGGHAPSAGTYGLAVAAAGYRLEPAVASLPTGTATSLAFRVRDASAIARTDFAIAHDVPMHLIVVRRDLTGFQHLHPVADADGTWSAPLTLAAPGPYRAFVDIVVPGESPVALTLSAEVFAAGDFRPVPVPPPSDTATVGAYTVQLDHHRGAGGAGHLRFTVAQDGQPVTDLDPYLGALGHLVVLRAGDLAYLHVHPDDSADTGPAIGFAATFPSAGDYGLFLQFAHRGAIVTTSFAVHIDDGDMET
jgi:hypothetical protein